MRRLALLFSCCVVACGGNVFVDGAGGSGATSPTTSSGLGGAPSTSSMSSTSTLDSTVVVVASSSSSSVSSSAVTTTSSSSGAGGGVCCTSDNQNDQAPASGCGAAQIWIAWEYDPSCDLALDRLEVHVRQGRVAFFADGGDEPGAPLFDAGLSPTTAPGWTGADIAPPIPVSPGQRYWIATKSGDCSTALQGAPLREFTSPNLDGPWDGPYMGDIFTSHILGACP